MRALAICLSACFLAAQTESFDVATLKFRKPPITFASGPFVRGRTVTAIALTARDLITYAYNIRYEQLSGGPSWIGDDHYDLIAKSEGEGVLPLAQSRQMMQALLAERFHLQVHRETQEVPMYALVIAKGGPKLRPAAPDTTGGCGTRGNAAGMHITCTRGTPDYVTHQLSGSVGRMVVDRTGLTGPYTFTLDWWPEGQTRPPDSDLPSIFDAVQEQLGLKLEATRGPLEKVIIDYIEKPVGQD